MAKKQITKYKFTPGSIGVGNVIIPGNYNTDKILLITNVTRGTILYNFADTQNVGASVTFKPGGIPTTNFDTSVVTYGRDLFGNPGSANIQRAESGYGETTITFTGANTATHSANDRISVLVEEPYQMVRMWSDFGTDAIERTRVAAPQSQIDADFEYGLQNTKWQGFQTVTNYPSIFESVAPDLVITDVVTDGADPSLITVSCNAHGLEIGDPITVSQLLVNVDGFGKAEGAFLIYSKNTNDFSYYAKGLVGTASQSIKDPRTQIRRGGIYSGADLPLSHIRTDLGNPSEVRLSFTGPHGFVPGMPIVINANPSWGSNTTLQFLPGSYFVNSIRNSNEVTITARGLVNPTTTAPGADFPSGTQLWGTGNIGNLQVQNTAGIRVYARPDGFFTHRPGDGGVIMGTNSPIHGASATRQSKKYFRYQSGKGFLYTTGVLFAPNYDIVSATSTGLVSPGVAPFQTISFTTNVPHGLQIGAVVRLRGVATTGYDGTYTIKNIVNEYTAQVDSIPNQNLGALTAAVSSVPKLYVFQFHGACLRTGPHDDANGMFFEYDGKFFNVVKRTSTLQLAGTVTITNNSNKLIGTNSLWTQQLKIGDKVVVKGMVHRITSITSDTEVSMAPDFRGVSSSAGNFIYKVEEVRVDQPNFNRDTADGSGSIFNPSGYKMDPNHMQMVGIQFSWYGAGFMDYMVRGHDANFIILHRFKQNNINIAASMRTANLPVRYEVINEAGSGVTGISPLTAGIDDNDTQMGVDDATFFPDSGVVLVENEIISYSSKTITSNPHTLNALTRAATFTTFVSGAARTFTGVAAAAHGVRTGVELISLTATPNMTHWGSSYIMDGGFDLDRGYIFTYTVTNANIVSTGNTVMALRLSPSASNSTVGDLGERELLNRAQILLEGLEISCGDQRTGGNVQILVTGILNPSNYNEVSQQWATLNNSAGGNQPSFSQTTANCFFRGQTYVGEPGLVAAPGETVFEFVYDPQNKQNLDLSNVKELSQSAIGGRGTFPNGADTLFINLRTLPGAVTQTVAGTPTNITGATTAQTFVSNVHVTLQWAEGQA
jgi:hypothetical protein